MIVSHNSVEHFESGADMGFLVEAKRMLVKGGKVVWIPLNLVKGGVNHTDVSIWDTKYRNDANFPKFDKRFPLKLGQHGQRLMKFYDPEVLVADLAKVGLDFTIYKIGNGKRGNKLALVGVQP